MTLSCRRVPNLWLFLSFSPSCTIYRLLLQAFFFVLQQTEQESTLIQLWLPFKTFYNKTVAGNAFCRAFEHFIRFHKFKFLVLDIMQIASILTTYLLAFGVFGFATLCICLIGMANKMLRHLNCVLTTLHPENYSKKWNAQQVKDVVKYAVQQHQRSIALIDAVNAMFSMTLLLDVWTFLFGICSVSYHIVKVPPHPLNFF
jgi:7tm Odorant receptor